MRLDRLVLVLVAVMGVLLGLRMEARASGGAESCVVTARSEPTGQPKIKGPAVVELFNFTLQSAGATADRADATLKLTDGQQTAVFRARIPSQFLVVSAEQVMCDIFAANPTATVVIDGVAQQRTIFEVFGFPTPANPTDSLKLCLVPKKSAPDELACQSIQNLDFNPIPGTSDYTGAMKLVIYVF